MSALSPWPHDPVVAHVIATTVSAGQPNTGELYGQLTQQAYHNLYFWTLAWAMRRKRVYGFNWKTPAHADHRFYETKDLITS